MGKNLRRLKKNTKALVKKRNRVYTFFLCVFVALFIYSLYECIAWYIDSKNTAEVIETILKSVEVIEKEDSEHSVVVEPTEEIDEANIYWDYITTKYIDVDINSLLETNSDTVAWLKVEGTNINYPVVQAEDNDYYLKYSFDGSYNSAGWLFADYRNSVDLTDRNLIIFGHSRLDGTMFGTLKNIISNGWLDDENNFLIKLSTQTENTVWQVFSVYTTEYTTDYLQVSFSTDDEFYTFASMLLNRSDYDFNTYVSKTDNIITLSTCYGDEERVVLHAKLIKSETKVS